MQAEPLGHSTSEKNKWDQFVRLSPQGSIFATTAYLDAIGAHYDLFVAYKNNSIDVGIPLVRNALGFHTNPLFCKYLGILTGADLSSKEYLVTSRLYERIDALGSSPLSALTFDYAFHPSFDNWMPFYWRGFSQQTQYTFYIYPNERETWWENAESRLRGSVKRGVRDGIIAYRLNDITSEALDHAYQLCGSAYQRRRARQPISKQKFSNLIMQLLPSGRLGIWMARDSDGTNIACAIILYDWQAAYLLMSGTVMDASPGAGPLLTKAAIDSALADGLVFDFEGSMMHSIERFYRSFGAHRVPYSRIWRPTLVNTFKHRAVRLIRKVGRYDR